MRLLKLPWMDSQTACRLVGDDGRRIHKHPRRDVSREGVSCAPKWGLAEREALALVMPGFRRGWCSGANDALRPNKDLWRPQVHLSSLP